MAQIQCTLFQLCLTLLIGLQSRIKYTVNFRRRLWTWHFIVSMSFMCTILGWDQLMLHINFACNIYHIIGFVIGSGGGIDLFDDLEELRQMNTSYMGKQLVELRESRCIGFQMRWVTFNYSDICLLISWHSRRGNRNSWEIHLHFLYHLEIKYQIIFHCLHLIPGCLIKGGRKFEIFESLQFQKYFANKFPLRLD